jgi:mono/diheme cytochrome c family protein
MYALALLLTFGLVVGLAGCGGEQPATTTDESQATSDQGDQDQTPEEPQDGTADETTDEMDEAEETADTSDQEETDETEQGQQDETSASGQEAPDNESMTAIERGEQIYNQQCMSCHSTDGSQRVGPTWKDAYGTEVTLKSGETVAYDEEYVRTSIRHPNEQIHDGYQANIMQPYGESRISEDELQALIAYIKSLSEATEDGEDGE